MDGFFALRQKFVPLVVIGVVADAVEINANLKKVVATVGRQDYEPMTVVRIPIIGVNLNRMVEGFGLGHEFPFLGKVRIDTLLL